MASSTTAAAATSTAVRATPQGGILEGGNPSEYDPKNPIVMFIIQVGSSAISAEILNPTDL